MVSPNPEHIQTQSQTHSGSNTASTHTHGSSSTHKYSRMFTKNMKENIVHCSFVFLPCHNPIFGTIKIFIIVKKIVIKRRKQMANIITCGYSYVVYVQVGILYKQPPYSFDYCATNKSFSIQKIPLSKHLWNCWSCQCVTNDKLCLSMELEQDHKTKIANFGMLY